MKTLFERTGAWRFFPHNNTKPWLIFCISHGLMAYWFRISFVTPRSLPAVLTPAARKKKVNRLLLATHPVPPTQATRNGEVLED